MDSENQKGLIGTIIFHGLLFLCVFLMSFAGGNSGGGNDSTGEALGGIEVSLGEPDLGGADQEAGYSEPVDAVATEKPIDQETLTEDDAEAPVLPSKEAETKPKTPVNTAPKITPPVARVVKPPAVQKRRPDSKSAFTKKGGNKGDGSEPGNQGSEDGSLFGEKDGGKGHGKGNGEDDGTGLPGNGPGMDDGPTGLPNGGTFDLSGFRSNNNFDIQTNRAGSGSVIIKLCVYKDGRLKSAAPTLGGTMTDQYFIQLALDAVKKNTYSPTGTSSSDKCGTVKFVFKTR